MYLLSLANLLQTRKVPITSEKKMERANFSQITLTKKIDHHVKYEKENVCHRVGLEFVSNLQRKNS